ncbi:RHS repeat-associated core domain-containing protein [Nocardioides dilutus]
MWRVVTSVLIAALVATSLQASWLAPAGATEPVDLSIPYGSPGWSYKVVGHGAEPGFEQAGTDDSAWSVGSTPFGNTGCAGTPAPNTPWPTNSDLLVRRTLDLNPATVTADLALKVAIDNDVDVFFNGVLIASNDFEGCGQEKATFTIPRSLVVDGDNVLAVRAIDRGSLNYLDLDLQVQGGADPEEPPVTAHDPVADAGPDQAVDEGSVVTLDGSGSQASLKPVLSSSSKNGSLPGGTSIGVDVAGLDPEAPEGQLRVTGSADLGQGPAVTNTSVAYVVDISGSTNDIVNCGGNINGDGRTNTVLDCEIAAVLALHEDVVASGTVEKVGLIALNSGAAARDLDPTSGVATLIAPDADKDGNGVLDLVQAAKALRVGGGTAFAPAVRTACQLLATTGSSNLVSAFMSDGEANDVLPPLPCNPPVTFQTFAVGAGSSCTYGSAGRGLDDIALKTGGVCLNVPNVENLPDILPQVIASRLTTVTYQLDDNPVVDISAELGLPQQGPVAVPLAIDLPSNLTPGAHRFCVTVTGTDSGGESSVETCSDLVMTTGELSYRWRQVSADGPPVVLTARTGKRPSFVATDDGTYVFELEVTDGLGGTATDEVTVTVANVAPAMTAEPGDAYAGGVTQVTGTFTDPGWVDTHSVTLDWGDGTTQEVPVSVQGSGWGTWFGSHVYATAGTYHLTAVLTDDDGGEATTEVGQLQVDEPVAVWANSGSLSKSLNWGGSEGNIDGRVHTNGLLRFVGARKTVRGGTTYAGEIAADTTRNSFLPEPVRTGVQDYPITFEVADYRPGGPVAQEIGAAYHDMTAACGSGTWHEVQTVLADGVYYAPCPIQLNGSDIGGRVTLVSEGTVKISGSRPLFEPYFDGLLLLAGSSATKAIDIAASSSKFAGVLFAGSGEISISGAKNRFFCGILADRVDITGGDTDIRGAACGRPDATVSGPVLVPQLTAGLAVDKEVVLPSQTLGYDLTVTNQGATLVAPALIGLENVDTIQETVTGYRFSLERLDAATGAWTELAGPGDDDFSVDLRPNAYPGVTYAGSGVAGTTVAPGAWATWGLQSVLDLSPGEVGDLLDPATTAGIRTRVDFDLSPTGAQARRLFTYGDNFIAAVRALSADVTDADATLLLPSGDAERIGPDAEAGLGGLAPGESVTVHRTWDVPVPLPRGAGETDAGYLTRLKLLDGSALTGGSFVLANGGVGQLVAPLTTVTSRRTLPVVDLKATGPSVVTAGTSADYALDLANVGSADASALDVQAAAASAPLPVTGAPTDLSAGERATAHTTYQANAVPADGTVPLRGTATWADAAGNSYGATGSTVDVTEQAPAKLQASLADMLVNDVGHDGATSPGDTVRYTAIVRNTGDATMSGVSADFRLDANTAFVAGSGVVQNGTVTHSDGVVQVTLPDVLGNTARTVTFDVVVADPFPVGAVEISAQGTVKATGHDDVLTDDLTLPGPADPTSTPVIRSFAALAGLLSGRLVVDADGNGFVSAGDTLAYQLEVNSVGTQIVTGIRVTAPTPAGTTLVDGSVTTTQGTVTPGPHAEVDLGTMGPLSQSVVEFRLKVDQPLAAGISAVSVQAEIRGDQISPQLSDDPATAELEDPTVLPVGTTGGGGTYGGQDGTGPAIGSFAPAEGTIVTEPVHITATLTPPDGQALDAWVVDYRRADTADVRVLETGTGGSVDAVLDPTILPNGTYVVTVRGTLTNGGLTTREITVVVDGQMKLGRYTTTLTDMTVGVAGLPISVQRTYDSLDKTTGDFGVGWNLGLADFRVSSNGPLGEGGWTMEGCGGGLIFATLCFTADRPHFVTVTWPDGKNEYFDLTPAKGSTFFTGLTSAEFTARSGSTSKLAAPDNSLFWVNGNLNGGAFGSDGPYDPTRFVLTDKYGTKYTLEVGEGLKKIEDRTGNVTTFSRTGITSSNGPSVTFTRNADDVITKITGPDGKTVDYGYDGNGDLVSVTNQLGATTEYGYLADHYLDTVTGPDAAVMARFEYQDGRIVAVIDGEGNRTEVSTDVGARQETVTDPGGKRTTITTYDAEGLVIRRNEIYGGSDHVTELAYDDQRNLVYRKDPNGHEWRSTWQNGDLTSITVPTGATARATYNASGQPLTWTDPAGEVTTWAYNANGTLRSETDAEGHTESYTYDAKGNRTSRTDANGDRWAWTFNSAGRLATETDPEGDVIRFEYDAMGNLTAEVDPLGHRIESTYDAAGRRLTSTDQDGRTTRWVYDERGLLERLVRADGVVEDYTYDGADRRTSVDNGVDAPTVFAHDAMGRVVSERVGASPASTFGYDGAGNLASATDELGRTTTYVHSGIGQLLSETNAAGGTTSYEYTPDGDLATVEDAEGGITRFTYNPTGQIATMTNPSGLVEQLTYDGVGNRLTTTYADGTSTRNVYDAAGQLVEMVDQRGGSTRFEYDGAGRQTAIVDAEGRRTVTDYDEAGRAVTVTEPGGGVSTTTYSPGGQVLTTTSPEGVTSTFEYNDRGLRTAIVDELGHRWTTTYDGSGRVLTERDPRQQGAGAATKTNAYDAYGRLASTTDALGATVQFGYDDSGQLTRVTDPRGKVWRMAYGPLGGVVERQDPLGRSTSATFDEQGRQISTTDARGVSVDYDYRPDGQLTSMVERGGDESVTFTYDSLGRRSTMTDASGVTAWTYTPDHHVASVTSPSGAVSYGYDRSGLRTSMTQPTGTVSYTHDASGHLDRVTDWQGRVTDADVDRDGRLRSLTRANGVATTWTYDAASRMTGLESVRGGAVVQRTAYDLDADGNRTALRTQAGVESYLLDAADQLTSVTYPGGETTTFSYDAAGNRLSSKVGSASPVGYVYDDASQLVSVGGQAVSHDANGNVVDDGSVRYDWDWLNRMTEVQSSSGTVGYTYDGAGNRVATTTGGATSSQLYDLATDDGSPELLADGDTSFVQGPAGVVSEDTATGTRYPLVDAVGSVRSVTDASGAVTGTTTYDPFGFLRSQSGVTSRFGFGGGLADGGLVHLGARDLDTRSGRFLSVDPVRPGGPGVVGWNPYAYAVNNPVTHTDPTGRSVAIESGNLYKIAVATALAIAILGFQTAQQFTDVNVRIPTTVPDFDWRPDRRTDEDRDPRPLPVPWPYTGDDDEPDERCLPRGLGSSWYFYAVPQPVWTGSEWKQRAWSATACIREPITKDGSRRHTPDGLIDGVHDRGHLIAASLGGSNSDPGNIVPLFHRANYPTMYWGFEAGALAAVRRGETLFYRAAAHYSSSSALVPYEVRLAYNGDKGAGDSATIPNVP